MKIILFTDSLGAGGSQRQWVGLAKLLKDNGYNVNVCTYHNIDFMFFRRDDDDKMKNLILNFDPADNCSINIVGKLGMSSFMGRPRCQVIVDDYEIVEDNEIDDFCF